jgi:CDP-paratose 2-epimerase
MLLNLMQKTILITGGCGFVGSNLAINFKIANPSFHIIAMDNLKRRGSELNLSRLRENGIEFIHGDIRNIEDFDEIKKIDILIDAAAEPSVISGMNSTPDYLINTNLLGTINCLNIALKHKALFILLSTSRVYPIGLLNEIPLNEDPTRFSIDEKNVQIKGASKEGINEHFPLSGARSFYGTTKLAAELLVEEYAAFYGLKTIVNRCGVLTGAWQMGKVDQGVVVLWMAKHFWKKELGYFGFGGEGKQVRDMLHVNDLFKLLEIQIDNPNLFANKPWNVGGGISISVSLQELTKICENITGNKIPIQSVKENRIADIPWYITDSSEIKKISGWEPTYTVEKIMLDVYEWIKKNEEMLKPILS